MVKVLHIFHVDASIDYEIVLPMYFNFQNNKYNRTMALLVTGETQLVVDFFLVFWFEMPSLLYTRSPTHVSLSVDRKHSMDTYLVICG